MLAVWGYALEFLLELPNLQQLLRLVADLGGDYALREAIVEGRGRAGHPANEARRATLQRRKGDVGIVGAQRARATVRVHRYLLLCEVVALGPLDFLHERSGNLPFLRIVVIAGYKHVLHCACL